MKRSLYLAMAAGLAAAAAPAVAQQTVIFTTGRPGRSFATKQSLLPWRHWLAFSCTLPSDLNGPMALRL